MNIPRILPLVGVAAVGVLALNALAGARDLPGLVTGARAFAEEAVKGATEKADLESIIGEEKAAEREERVKRAYALRRLGEPEDVANTVVYLASSAARHITGQVLNCDGGMWMHS